MFNRRRMIILSILSIFFLTGCVDKKLEKDNKIEVKEKTNKNTKEDIESYFIDKAKKYNIDIQTLRAICKHESKFNPYAINVNKNKTAEVKELVGSYNFNIKEEAQLFMNVVFDKPNLSFDVGYCQINNQHFTKNNLESEDLLDIEKNIELSAKIYRYGVDRCIKANSKNLVECSLSMYNTGKLNTESPIGIKYAQKVINVKNKL